MARSDRAPDRAPDQACPRPVSGAAVEPARPPKPYAPACERNKEPLLAVLREVFAEPGRVLEIGSGTGQHAVHFAAHLPHLHWQPTDRPPALRGIGLWVEEAGLDNLAPPLALDVADEPWPLEGVEYVFSANTAHIMAWEGVQHMFRGVGRSLREGGVFCLYGPFHYGGRPTSPSNAAFDVQLRGRDPRQGLRNFEAVNALAEAAGLMLADDRAMPANNRTLIWRSEAPGRP